MNISDLTLGFNQVIDTLGVPAVFSRAKVPGASTNIAHVGFANVSRSDEAMVNAYGVSGKIITVKVASITGNPPEKFDAFHINAEKYVADTVIPIHAPGTGVLVGWKVLVKGR
jgi:hypothetical protein